MLDLCSGITCPVDWWKYSDNIKCIQEYKVCDRTFLEGCYDGSDEVDLECENWDCTQGRWKFVNNQATDRGGALFASGECLILTISKSSFEVRDQLFDSPRGVFVFSLSTISIAASVFSRNLTQPSPSLLEMEMLSDGAQIGYLNFTVQCHAWFSLNEATSVLKQSKDLKVMCKSCPASFSAPSEGHYLVSFLANESSVSLESMPSKSLQPNCILCPAGANCPGYDLTASPNCWGHNTGIGITMCQCPAEYCCSQDCTGYNECEGVLCGSCEEIYSLSLLSSQCLYENTCTAHWLWLVVLVAMAMSMLWYTFKYDIFDIPLLA